MKKMILLGSSNAIPDEDHGNTYMALAGENQTILIDCACNPLLRFKKANLDVHTLSDLILTHFHPDHVTGVPLLLMNLWLLGRRAPLTIHGLGHTLSRMEKLMALYGWENWPEFYPVHFHRLSETEMELVLQNNEVRIFASPVKHIIPTIGLRVESSKSQKVLAYSCDTEPCPQVIQLAQGANWLIHEAHGECTGHSSAAQAGDVASQAQAKALILIHYPTRTADYSALVAEASKTFAGPVSLANDFMEIDLT